MSLITETGTGSTTAESLCSVADSLTYHADRGNATWATITTAQQEQALRRATDYMEQVYAQRWQGTRTTSTQALSWPRYNVVVNGYVVSSSGIPLPIIRACAELALKAASGELLSDTTQQKIRTKVGEIEVEFDRYSPQSAQYLAITSLLQPYFDQSAGIVHKVIR